MGFVIGLLNGAPAVGLVYGVSHGIGNFVGIEDHQAIGISRCPACGLGQGAIVAEETFFIGIEDSDEGHLWQIESFAEQVNADQHIELAQSKIAQDFHPFHRIHFGVDISHAYIESAQVLGQFFRHAFSQGSNQHPFVSFSAFVYFFEEVINLVETGSHFDRRIE